MRIAVIAHSHPTIRVGGGEVAALREFEEFSRRGMEAVFVGMAHDENAAAVFRGGQRIVAHGPNDFIVKAMPFDVFGYEWMDVADEDFLFDFLHSLDVEAYHFHHFWNVGAGVIRRLMRARPDALFALTLHEYQAICAADGQLMKPRSASPCMRASPVECTLCRPEHSPLDHVVRRRKLTALLSAFDILIAPSRFLAQRFTDWGVPLGRIHVLENGLSVPSEASPRELTLEARASRFAFFGQATPTKGLNVLVDAAAHLAKTSEKAIAIDVYGVSEAGFLALYPAAELPENITFRGRYQPGEVVNLMKRFGWIVMPSIWWENSPVVIQEARAARVPMIAARLGGVLEKTEGWSLHFSPGDPLDLARVIDAVAGNAEVLAAQEARITPPLSTSLFVDELLKLFADVRREPAPAEPRQSVDAAA
jgi:glycosyltransferase involved in cell wall biosynthesis